MMISKSKWELSANFNRDATNPAILQPCHDVGELVRLFNESTENSKEDIKISAAECVEVSL